VGRRVHVRDGDAVRRAGAQLKQFIDQVGGLWQEGTTSHTAWAAGKQGGTHDEHRQVDEAWP
jgi:hypothetical protein